MSAEPPVVFREANSFTCSEDTIVKRLEHFSISFVLEQQITAILVDFKEREGSSVIGTVTAALLNPTICALR